MPSIFSNSKKTSFFTLGLLLLLSSPLIQADDSSRCWRDAYYRGSEEPISVCADGLEQGGLLCYPPCKDGYNGVGPVCWQECPTDFTNTGVDCLKPSAYGRGTGYFLWHESECEQENPQGCEKYGALYYPKCKEGYYAFGCCICSPDCPDGMTDIGVSCQKDSYGRGAGVPLVCKDNEEPYGSDGFMPMCIEKCRNGFTSDDDNTVCWGDCPAGMYQCGALCVESEDACTGDLKSTASDVFDDMGGEVARGTAGQDVIQTIYQVNPEKGNFPQYGTCSY